MNSGKRYDLRDCSMRKYHYQLTGSHLNRLCENVKKLTAEIGNCDVTFCDNDIAFHVTSKAMLPEDCTKELLQHKIKGNEIFQESLCEQNDKERNLSGQQSQKENLKPSKPSSR